MTAAAAALASLVAEDATAAVIDTNIGARMRAPSPSTVHAIARFAGCMDAMLDAGLFAHTLLYLDGATLASCALVARRWQCELQSASLWERRYCERWRDGRVLEPPEGRKALLPHLRRLCSARACAARDVALSTRARSWIRANGNVFAHNDALVREIATGGTESLRTYHALSPLAVCKALGATVSYFEATLAGCGSVGLAAVNDVAERRAYGAGSESHLGWFPVSYGYHGDDGCVYWNAHTSPLGRLFGGMRHAYGPIWGDTTPFRERRWQLAIVGCGHVLDTRQLFFTLNGEFVGFAPVETKPAKELAAAVSLHQFGDSVELNFGCNAFAFDIEHFTWETLRPLVAAAALLERTSTSTGDGGGAGGHEAEVDAPGGGSRHRPSAWRAVLLAALALVRGAGAALNSYVPVDHGFEFNGKHSDFAQQYYVRYVAKDEAPQLTRVRTADLPDSLQKELKTYALTWEELPGLLQRALLWDAGYALTSDMSILPVFTRNERSMAEIFVPRKAYERTGCTPRSCTLPSGELFSRHQSCDGEQMARVSLCALDGARQRPHAAMWGDGAQADALPEVRVTRHEWTEQNRSFLMYALHTVAEEVVYDACPREPAMIIPCAPLALVADRAAWRAPKRGQVVEAWLKKYSEDHQENRTWLLVPLTIVVFALFAVITVYRYKAAVRDSVSESDDLAGRGSSFFDSGSVEAFLLTPRSGADDGDSDGRLGDAHPEGDLNAAAFEYFDASIGLSASAFDPTLASFNRVHPLRSLLRLRASKRNEVAIRSFRLFESHRKIRAKRVPLREVALQKLLSHGASGEVWLAVHRGQQLRLVQFPLRLLKLVLNEGYRPTLSPTCPPRIADLVARCLDRDQEKRPTAHDICVLLAAADEAVEELV
ncbi:hypothetical protein PybrP1_003600 [[Pythium] brassicae (nom. inval.)]|nr:hypothetical protein PybrP1_003600 [[Pythium] brassicae (nom. inval.)]